jgi:hypothetical protein
MTKKIAILAVLLYIAGTVSGQEFTFQGLPWGSTRDTSVSGYLSLLNIDFHNDSMQSVYYDVGRFQRLSVDQLKTAFRGE